jgi:hypothetical protein
MTTRTVPILGIIDDCDAPQPNMVAVVMWSGRIGGYKWEYVDRRHRARYGKGHCRTWPEKFTPLQDFGVLAIFRTDGALRFERFRPSAAKYHDGVPRDWQGDRQPEFIFIRPYIASPVLRAVEQMHADVLLELKGKAA